MKLLGDEIIQISNFYSCTRIHIKVYIAKTQNT